MKLINDVLAPVPDLPDRQVSPVFAVQGNFIHGGLIVAIYLHHSVADLSSFRTIIKYLSSDTRARELTNKELEEDVAEESRIRSLLSGSGVVEGEASNQDHVSPSADSVEQYLQNISSDSSHATCCLFSFDLKLIERTKEIANNTNAELRGNQQPHLSAFDVLATILWKAVVRARCQPGQPIKQDGKQLNSTLVVPIDIRERIDPPLDTTFFGNAVMQSLASTPIPTLLSPYDPVSLAFAAPLIRGANARVTDARVRSAIAGINASSNPQSAPIKKVDSSLDLVITSWADLWLEDAHLGLDLGKPEWGRKLGRGQTARECILHPVRRQEGLWEVMVQLTEDVMSCLMADEDFMEFVRHVA